MAFRCNVCGRDNPGEVKASEPASCACGSNVRIRAMMHLLSTELFGSSIGLGEFPALPSLRAMGTSDHAFYAELLAGKLDYTNTFLDRPPFFDLSKAHPEQYGQYDFVLSADVLEHVPPPAGFTFAEIARILKPNGFLVFTVFCGPGERTKEYFPSLHEYRVVPLGDGFVLVNRRADGTLETFTNLVFHAGGGSALEMREFSLEDLRRDLMEAGFTDVTFLGENIPELGIVFDHDTSQPAIARKGRFSLGHAEVRTLLRDLRKSQAERDALKNQLADVRRSRWVKLGRRMGLGPLRSDQTPQQ